MSAVHLYYKKSRLSPFVLETAFFLPIRQMCIENCSLAIIVLIVILSVVILILIIVLIVILVVVLILVLVLIVVILVLVIVLILISVVLTILIIIHELYLLLDIFANISRE